MSSTTEKPNTVERSSSDEKHDVNYSQKEENVSVDEVSELSQEWLEPPDGGFKAWLVVFGCFCSFLCSQGYGYSWGVYFDHYNEVVYPGNMTALTWIGSLWYWFANVTGPFYLWMTSKVDDRWIVAAACLICTLAMMLASITNAVWQLYLTQGVLSGIGTSLCWFSCMRAPQQWFSKRRGLAVGITLAASGCGGLIISNMSNACFQTIGYRWALRVLGFFNLVFLGIAAVTCFRLNPTPKNTPVVDVKDWKNKKFVLLVLIHFIGNFAFYIPSSYVPAYASHLGIDSWVKTNLSAVMSAMMVVGKIGLGFCSDYIGRFNMAVICGCMACIAHLAVWLTAHSDASMWAFAVLYGLFGGGYIAMITAVIGQVAGEDRIDSGTGWCFFAWSWGGFAAQPVASAIVEASGGNDFTGAIVYGGVLFFAGAMCCVLLRYMQGGSKIWQKV